MKIYKDIDKLPSGTASDKLTEGNLVLEGGGWKGLYTVGVLDCMMKNDVNLTTVTGVSAGALSAIGYVSGHGIGALKRDRGITGFSYLFDDILKALPLDEERLYDPARKLAVSAANMLTGKVEYFEKGKCDLFRAVQASASVPFASKPVLIDGVPYLDGGCAEKIPLSWQGLANGKKTVVVRTRELSYRRKPGAPKLTKLVYRKYPNFIKSLERVNEEFNKTVDELERGARDGSIFLIAPSKPVEVTRFDGDMDKLGNLYWLGWNDMAAQIDSLKKYLG